MNLATLQLNKIKERFRKRESAAPTTGSSCARALAAS